MIRRLWKKLSEPERKAQTKEQDAKAKKLAEFDKVWEKKKAEGKIIEAVRADEEPQPAAKKRGRPAKKKTS